MIRASLFPRRALLLAAFVWAGGGAARAAGPYLHGFDAATLVPPPPAPGSAEDKADQDSTFAVYSRRTVEDIARTKAQHDFDVFAFTPDIGPGFTAERCPKLAALFKSVIAEARPVIDVAKKQWHRPRPYVLDPQRFSDPADHEGSFSYPSGHSTRATLDAFLLVELFPRHRDAILAQARLIGWTRVEAGVHTPLDIHMGRVLGQALARKLLADPQFQADLAAARGEAAAAEGS